jgi:hypothetical protein
MDLVLLIGDLDVRTFQPQMKVKNMHGRNTLEKNKAIAPISKI